MDSISQKIIDLAEKHARDLDEKLKERVNEMQNDDLSHYLIYRVLGISEEEGNLIDLYQNKGRLLYRSAGSFLEKVAVLCFKHKFPSAQKIVIPNDQGTRPKTFEIDCLVDNRAHEIKWREATTDGDHISKEHERVKATQSYGFTPIRVMFYYPNRKQSVRVQEILSALYNGLGGEYYYGDKAWNYLAQETDIDLKKILSDIASLKER